MRARWVVGWVLAVAAGGAGPAAAAVLAVTDLGDSGQPGQLRTLINAANPGDVILVPPGTVTLAVPPGIPNGNFNPDSGDLDIDKNLSIQGAGPDRTVIDGGGLDRVLEIFESRSVAIAGVTVRNGAPGPQGRGGGILNAGRLTLTGVVVRDSVTTIGPESHGGGILNQGAGAELTMVGGALVGNRAGLGTEGFGGGLSNLAGTARLTNVTISGNQATARGGGIYNTGLVQLTNVTVTDNLANSDDAGGGDEGGGVFATPALGVSTVLRDTIVAGNRVGAGGASPDCSALGPSAGHNLVQDPAGCVGLDAATDLTLTDPLLAPLAPNGGGSPTHALLPGSPALDAGDAACAPVDQRGVPRPQGLRCDLGAFERGGPGLASLDFDRDGKADVVVASGRGQEPRVRVLAGATGVELRSFLAYDPAFRGGVHVAVCDLDGDGIPDVVTAPAAGPPLVRAFNGVTGQPFPAALGGFVAFPAGPRALGATVGCADLSGDGVPDIIVGTGPGPDSQVLSFSGVDGSPLAPPLPAFPGFRGGVFVAP